MASAVQELNQIPFGTLIGAPMKAAVEAQAMAAQSSIEFIKEVGFTNPDKLDDGMVVDDGLNQQDTNIGDVRTVTFKYKKNDNEGIKQSFELEVPLLSMVPIPYLRIDHMDIEFNAKLNDVVSYNYNNESEFSGSVSGSYSSFWSPVRVSFRASASYKSSSSSQTNRSREYNMNIKVHAVQDEMPGGLSRIIDILEQAIDSGDETDNAPA